MLSSAHSLDWLERLLQLAPEARAAEFERLATFDPQLHGRVVRLLEAAQGAHAGERGQSAARGEAGGAALRSGQCVGGYCLERELGRGGMAVVWLAQRADAVIKRQVALKLPLQSVATSTGRARFAQEKDMLAGLEHPHIARLYDAGVDGQQPFIALEFVDGMPITRYCDRHGLDVNARLQLFLQVLAAVDHAHRHLIVHRDLKPSNILVDTAGQVKLLDFGIAKLLVDPTLNEADTLTQVGNAVLTPIYSAPEQATGQPISTSTDIFVLGVVLHELLTGTLPYTKSCGDTPALAQIVDALLRSDPTLPSRAQIDDAAAQVRANSNSSRLRAVLRGDLDTMVGKALSYSPMQRYSSAESFAEDVRRYLEHRPILARPHGRRYAARLFLRRHRVASLAVGAALLLAVLGATVAVLQYFEAQANAARAIATRDFMFDTLARAEPVDTHAGGPVTARQLIDDAVQRARERFTDQPYMQGELLSELGRIYSRLEDAPVARPVLEQAWQLLERSAPRDDAALNQARTQMAGVLLQENQPEPALRLATLARDNCRARSIACSRVRANANAKLSDIHRMAGRTEESIEAMRETAEDAVAAYGEDDSGVIAAFLNLGIQLRNAGRPLEAKAAVERADAAASKGSLMLSDRIKLGRMGAMLDLDLGRYAAARARFEELLAQTESPRERAVHLRMLGAAHLGAGDPAAALTSAAAGLALAAPTDPSPEPVFARQVAAQAHALLGEFAVARTQIDAAISDMRAMGRSESAPELLRLRRSRAEILLRSAVVQPAQVELEALLALLNAQASPAPYDLAQVLDLLGCAQRELGRAAAAVASHRRARELLQRVLPAEHPFLLRNALYQAAAAGDSQQFARLAEQARRLWAADSVWLRVIAARQDASSCGTAAASCTFVL